MVRPKSELNEFRKKLNSKKTRAEQVLEATLSRHIRGKGSRLKAQYVLGFYIADFFYRSRNLVIEVDGSIHETSEQKLKDARRDSFFESKGIRVLRLTNEEILNNPVSCIQKILAFPMLPKNKRSKAIGRCQWARKHAVKKAIACADWRSC